MPKALGMEKQLSDTDERLARLRALVEALPEGDQDRQDLILLFTELERVKRLHRAATLRRNERRHIREENRRLHGALSLARYALKLADKKVKEQEVTIGWLCRRLKRGEKLQGYEKEELRSLMKERVVERTAGD